MVAPVTVENSTSVDVSTHLQLRRFRLIWRQVYMPDDVFYDFYTHEAIRGTGAPIHLPNVPYTAIPLFYRGGNIVALRASSANTTTELRKQDFALVIAPGLDGTASGLLYLDDGQSLMQQATSSINFYYDSNGFSMNGTFGYNAGVSINSITVLGGSGNGTNLLRSGTTIPLNGPYSTTNGSSGSSAPSSARGGVSSSTAVSGVGATRTTSGTGATNTGSGSGVASSAAGGVSASATQSAPAQYTGAAGAKKPAVAALVGAVVLAALA